MKKHLNYFIALATMILFGGLFNYDLLSALAVGIFAYWISALLIRGNDSLPIKELFLSLYGLQYLFGAALTYNGIDEYNYFENQMKVPSNTYFIYTIPVFLSFCLGFSIFSKKDALIINRDSINQWVTEHPQLPYTFIIIGFLVSFTAGIFPSGLDFIFYSVSGFKYIGIFILLMSYRTIKPGLMVLIYGSILISSFQGGMFHDLLIWIIILALILSYRYKPSLKYKVTGLVVFGIFAIFIQSIKGGLREETWTNNKDASVSIVKNVTRDVNSNNGGMFSMENLGPNIIRINQGWVLASTLDNVPRIVGHTNGALTVGYFYAALVPRLFDEDKIKSGGHEYVERYAGINVGGSTSIALGLFTDAYLEFGQFGAIIYTFLFGLLYGYILNQFFVRSKQYPILILFAVLVFVFPMRPDCETVTALNHLFKTTFFLIIIIYFFKKTFLLSATDSKNT